MAATASHDARPGESCALRDRRAQGDLLPPALIRADIIAQLRLLASCPSRYGAEDATITGWAAADTLERLAAELAEARKTIAALEAKCDLLSARLKKADMPRDHIEALAECWASIDGKSEAFAEGRGKSVLDDRTGHYAGYMVESEEMISRLRKRGFDVVATRGEPVSSLGVS